MMPGMVKGKVTNKVFGLRKRWSNMKFVIYQRSGINGNC